jgi:hypothetical protein
LDGRVGVKPSEKHDAGAKLDRPGLSLLVLRAKR